MEIHYLLIGTSSKDNFKSFKFLRLDKLAKNYYNKSRSKLFLERFKEKSSILFKHYIEFVKPIIDFLFNSFLYKIKCNFFRFYIVSKDFMRWEIFFN